MRPNNKIGFSESDSMKSKTKIYRPFKGSCYVCKAKIDHQSPYVHDKLPQFMEKAPKCYNCRRYYKDICEESGCSAMVSVDRKYEWKTRKCADCRKKYRRFWTKKQWEDIQYKKRQELDPFEFDCISCGTRCSHSKPYYHKKIPIFDKSAPKCATCRKTRTFTCTTCPVTPAFTTTYDLTDPNIKTKPIKCPRCHEIKRIRKRVFRFKDGMMVKTGENVLKISYKMKHHVHGSHTGEDFYLGYPDEGPYCNQLSSRLQRLMKNPEIWNFQHYFGTIKSFTDPVTKFTIMIFVTENGVLRPTFTIGDGSAAANIFEMIYGIDIVEYSECNHPDHIGHDPCLFYPGCIDESCDNHLFDYEMDYDDDYDELCSKKDTFVFEAKSLEFVEHPFNSLHRRARPFSFPPTVSDPIGNPSLEVKHREMLNGMDLCSEIIKVVSENKDIMRV